MDGFKVVASTTSPVVYCPSNLWGSRDRSSVLRSCPSVSVFQKSRSYALRRVGSAGPSGDFSDEEISAAVAFTATAEAPPEWWGKCGGAGRGGGRGREAMIKKRQRRLEEGFREAAGGEFANCAMKKAFSSMVLGVREVQRWALLREHVNEAALARVQSDTNASFVWLFQSVFAETPALMVYVMVLLVNFTANSSSSAAAIETTGAESKASTESNDVNVVGEEQGSEVWCGGGEAGLWESMAEETSWGVEADLDLETIGRLVSPVTVEMEADDYIEYFRTELGYQMGLAEDPNNPMLLCNYAQFLFLVARDHDRAEECFKRALERDATDAESLSKYADFLWVARKDLWAAEEKYQQAVVAAPENPHITYKYACFLWSSGAEDTCLINP